MLAPAQSKDLLTTWYEALLQEGECPWYQKYHCERVFYTMVVSAEVLHREFWRLRVTDRG